LCSWFKIFNFLLYRIWGNMALAGIKSHRAPCQSGDCGMTASQPKMKNYLSFGGGVNSVALYLLLMEQGLEPGNADTGFEAVYVWMPDWPETHEYLMMMEYKGYPVTVIFPSEKYANLYEYAWEHRMFPRRYPRWCTSRFKVKPLHNYFLKPCFSMIGIDAGESKRAKIASTQGIENRWPLIENDIDREGCLSIIKRHVLPVPMRSGCFICPFQRVQQVKDLRRIHPELFCKLVALEERNIDVLKTRKGPYYTMGKPFKEIVNEKNSYLFKEMSYPPCECGL
jgi:hypothetical protein